MSALAWLGQLLPAPPPARSLASGAALFRQGDPARAIYGVEAGRVDLIRHGADGRRVLLHRARAGELFSEAALFSEVYHCDAVAAMPSQVRILAKSALLQAFRREPAQAERFMALLARQVQSLRGRIALRDVRSARERVLAHLELRAGAARRVVTVEGTLKELAAELGLTHESLYRTLAALERDGSIRRNGRSISLTRRAR